MHSKRLLQLMAQGILACFVLLAFASTAHGQVYLSSTSGSNAFDGSSATVDGGGAGPKATLGGASGALSAVARGETIFIEAGAYAEDFALDERASGIFIEVYAAGAVTEAEFLDGEVATDDADGDTDDTVTLTGGAGSIVITDGDFTLTDGDMELGAGKLSFDSDVDIVVTDGRLTGSSPGYDGSADIDYNATDDITAGAEMAANLNGGFITIDQALGDNLTVSSAVVAGGIFQEGAGHATFEGNVTINEDDVQKNDDGDLTFEADLTIIWDDAASDGFLNNADTDGELTVIGTLTFQNDADDANDDDSIITSAGTTTNLANVAFTVVSDDDAGNDSVTRTIDNAGDLNISGNVTEQAIDDTDDADFTDEVIVDVTNADGGTIDIGGTLDANDITDDGEVTVTGATTASGDLTVGDADGDETAFNGGIALDGDLIMAGADVVSFGADSNIDGDVDNGGTLDIADGVTVDLASGASHTALGTVTGDAGTVLISDDGDLDAGIDTEGNLTMEGDGNITTVAIAVDGTLTLSGANNLDIAVDVGGNLVVTEDGSSDFGVTGDVDGTLDVDGIVDVEVAFTVGAVTIQDDGDLEVETTVILTVQGDFDGANGGSLDANAADSAILFALTTDADVTFGPNEVISELEVTGAFTLNLLQSVQVDEHFLVAAGSTVNLTNKLLRLVGDPTSVDVDGTVTATANSGALSFEEDTQTIDGLGTFTNIIINNAACGTPTAMAVDIEITGRLTLFDCSLDNGGFDIDFDDGEIERNTAAANLTAITGAGDITGVYDLTYSGETVAANDDTGLEYDDASVRNVTFNVDSGGFEFVIDLAATIAGNFTVGEDAELEMDAATEIEGSFINNGYVDDDGSDGAIELSGAGVTHTNIGELEDLTDITITGDGAIFNGSADDGDDALFGIVTVGDGADISVTIANAQAFSGVLTVDDGSSLTLSMADEEDINADLVLEDDATVTMASDVNANEDVLINDGATVDFGAFFVHMTDDDASDDDDFGPVGAADVTFAGSGGISIDDGTITFGSNGAEFPTIVINDGTAALSSDAGVATLDLNEDLDIDGNDLTVSGEARFAEDADIGDGGPGGTVIAAGTEFIAEDTSAFGLADGTDSDHSLPDFEVSSTGTATFSTEDADGALFDVDMLTFTTGILSLDGVNMEVNDDIFFAGGSFSIVEGDEVLILDGGTTDIDYDVAAVGTLSVPNVEMTDDVDINDDATLIIEDNFTLTSGTFFVDTDGSLQLGTGDDLNVFRDADDADLEVDGTLAFGATNTDVFYTDGAGEDTGVELPTTVGELSIGGNVTIADGRDIVTMVLDLDDDLAFSADPGESASVTVAEGGTVELGAGAEQTDGFYELAGAANLVLNGIADGDAEWLTGWVPTMLTVDAASTIDVDKTAVDVDGDSELTIFADGDVLTVTGILDVSGGLTFDGAGAVEFGGAAAQEFDATGDFEFGANLIINNALGVTLTGGDVAMECTTTMGAADLSVTFTDGIFSTGDNSLELCHINTSNQGFTQTSGGVDGTVIKEIDGDGEATANRVQVPIVDASGDKRTAAITFNNPDEIGDNVRLTFQHVLESPGGSNNMPQITVDDNGQELRIARLSPFYWLITSGFTLSPSVSYDVEFHAQGYDDFTGEDIERTRTVRRQAHNNESTIPDDEKTNFWALVGGGVAVNNDNSSITTSYPRVSVREAVGALLDAPGTIFTLGLESNLFATGEVDVEVNANETDSSVDVAGLFTGGTAPFDYTVATADGGVATATIVGTTLEVTGVAAGTTELTVTIVGALNDTADATVNVTVNAAFAETAADTPVALNAGTSADFTLTGGIFDGGSTPYTYVITDSDGAVASGSEAAGILTISALAEGGPVTVTVDATDDTGATASATFTVSVNATLAAGAIADFDVTQGQTDATTDLSAVVSGGDGTYTYTVGSGDEAVATATEAGGIVSVTGVAAYDTSSGTLVDTVPVTVTVDVEDGLGSAASTSFAVDVMPVLGDTDGDTDADVFDALLALDFAVGTETPTTKQFFAADWNANGTIQAFDAFAIYNSSASKEIAANVAANLSWGEVTRTEFTAELPVAISGDAGRAVAAQLWTKIDPAVATVTGVTFLVEDAIGSAYNVTEEGDVTLAVFGGVVPTDGVIATISLEMVQGAGQLQVMARGAVNDNAAADIDELEVVELPGEFALLGNYPNPFNPSTTIQFDLPATSEVSIEIYDMLGRRVMLLPAQSIQAGAKRSLQVNASSLASGSYFYRVIATAESSTMVDTGRMLLVK